MKFPYGIRNFDALISEGYIYLDRTDRIPILEELGKELLFLRPRRFGKSLWLSTLMNYYDIAKADDFSRLFGHLAIGQSPTLLQNQYMVMRWDFSEIKSHGAIEQIEVALHQHLNQWIEKFILDYQQIVPALSSQIRIDKENSLNSFHSTVAAVGRNRHKLYLFVDEYDNFANEVMMGHQGQNAKRYEDLISGEGMFKTLFKNLKSAGSGEGLDRLFMTGVSPVVMNDVSSGANTVEDISWTTELKDLCGFREDEVAGLTTALATEIEWPHEKVTETLEMMRIFYNGSCFEQGSYATIENQAQEDVGIYNPTLVFYFLKYLQRNKHTPREMLDSNLAPDYNKLRYISTHPHGKDLLTDAIDDNQPISVPTLNERFGMTDMLEANNSRDRLAVLLCYLGALTVGGTTATGELILQIPNLVIRRLYAERILDLAFPNPVTRDIGRDAADRLFAQGEIGPICEFIEQYYMAVYNNRDTVHFNELTVKTLFLAALQHNQLYIMDSEPALRQRYADLIMLIRPEMRHFSIFDLLIEFKYLSLKALNAGTGKLSGEKLQKMTTEEVVALKPVQAKLNEARNQLVDYQQVLHDKYGNSLKLRSYIVVAVGLGRLYWQEL